MNPIASFILDEFYDTACEDAKEWQHVLHGAAQPNAAVIAAANHLRNAAYHPQTFYSKQVPITAYPTPKDVQVQTPKGRLQAPDGWWMIQDAHGAVYPCAPDAFAQKYERLSKDHTPPASELFAL